MICLHRYGVVDLKWDKPLRSGGLPFNSFIGNVALKD